MRDSKVYMSTFSHTLLTFGSTVSYKFAKSKDKFLNFYANSSMYAFTWLPYLLS